VPTTPSISEQPRIGEVLAVSHVGLCVSDFDRSLRFYTEGLGSEVSEGFDIGDSLAHLAELPPPVECRSQMLVKGEVKLELLGWKTPRAVGTPAKTRHEIGFTHLSVYVDDVPEVEARLIGLGATTVKETRSHIPMPGGVMDVLFLADPDGIRIELVRDPTRTSS
jgi:catechol 2,3-dioxygenase-like lactoylglutathione lyase family enzyme